uniref:Uncharacterized protein n=1 Tax=Amphora coffeiformis TaxID=265554 RepID=A0A7S3LA63_9STRA|mmetsp:Transcript_1903/g.4173  ORF Transcript_1903/g.4173 Transcript_1903/m.4173 type:complete len:495 (-) Transcript_1903:217-1701(-)|eukprot:scaffold1048_cov90-Amphora_coffeaeformis.AAC.12
MSAKQAYENQLTNLRVKIFRAKQQASIANPSAKAKHNQIVQTLEAQKQAFIANKEQFLSRSLEELEAERVVSKQVSKEQTNVYAKERSKLRKRIQYFTRLGRMEQVDNLTNQLEQLKMEQSNSFTMSSNGSVNVPITPATPARRPNIARLPPTPRTTEGMTPRQRKEWFLEEALATEKEKVEAAKVQAEASKKQAEANAKQAAANEKQAAANAKQAEANQELAEANKQQCTFWLEREKRASIKDLAKAYLELQDSVPDVVEASSSTGSDYKSAVDSMDSKLAAVDLSSTGLNVMNSNKPEAVDSSSTGLNVMNSKPEAFDLEGLWHFDSQEDYNKAFVALIHTPGVTFPALFRFLCLGFVDQTPFLEGLVHCTDPDVQDAMRKALTVVNLSQDTGVDVLFFGTLQRINEIATQVHEYKTKDGAPPVLMERLKKDPNGKPYWNTCKITSIDFKEDDSGRSADVHVVPCIGEDGNRNPIFSDEVASTVFSRLALRA